MSGGRWVDVKASSASEAIYKALDRYRGETVAECYSGSVFMSDKPGSMTGQIHYEIPKHSPLPFKEKEAK